MTPAEIYETDIEPRLREIAMQCKFAGISMVVQVELPQGRAEHVVHLAPSPGAAARLTNAAVMAAGKFDVMAVMFTADARRRGLIP